MDGEEDFSKFKKYLLEACKEMKSDYFNLDCAGSEGLICRERVYYYELYHQLCCLINEKYNYILHGEVEKAGHPEIKGTFKNKKSDFIIHSSNTISKNLVMEVKAIIVMKKPKESEKD